MVHVTNAYIVLFCLLFCGNCIETESRFVHRDTGENHGNTDATDLSKSTNQEENENTGATTIKMVKENTNLNGVNLKEGQQSETTSLKPETQNVERHTISTDEHAAKNDFKQSYSTRPTAATHTTGNQDLYTENVDQDKETVKYNIPESDHRDGIATQKPEAMSELTKEHRTEEEQKHKSDIRKWTSDLRSDIFRPNGLERDIDDPGDVITHIKPCENADVSCNIDNENPNTYRSDKNLTDNPVGSVGNGQTGSEYIQNKKATSIPSSSNPEKMHAADSDSKEHKRFVGSSDEAGYDDAYF